jgi:hypothetical protein
VDALIVRPLVQRLALTGAGGRATELVSSTSRLPLPATVGVRGTRSTVASYDSRGALVSQRTVSGQSVVLVRGGGFVVVTR